MVKVIDKRSFTPDGELKEKTEKKEKKSIYLPAPPTFSEFIMSLYASAMINMGLIQVKGEEKQEIDLPQAKQTIDVMELILKKTEGNLTDEEKNLINNLLTELRLNFVELIKKL